MAPSKLDDTRVVERRSAGVDASQGIRVGMIERWQAPAHGRI